MKTTKIHIKNLFGIKETELDGCNIEITGDNGTGKTSVIDAIRYALTNDSDRDYIVRQGETEGEILLETDSGLSINRKKRTTQSDYKQIREDGKDVPKPESFLSQIFTPLQLDPVAFTQMSRQEQNRVILDLIEFPWDLSWVKNQFGEIPQGVNYEQNILQVLHDIQADDGNYFMERQDVNRDIRNKRAFIEDIAKDIPSGYQTEKWENFELSEQYKELERIRRENALIERANAFKENYDSKIRGFEATKEITIASEERAISNEKENLLSTIERLKAEIIAAQDKLNGLDGKLKDRIAIAEAQYKEQIARLETSLGEANKYAGKTPLDTASLTAEISIAEAMKKHLNEYKRMKTMENEVVLLKQESDELTRKIELARELPGEILKTATIPVEGLSVKDGIPLIRNLPVSNLSEGEQLDLCVDVAISNPNALQIILIDGAEKLSDRNRNRLYSKCKDRGLQFIATRTTNDNELEVTTLC